ncbi:MAG: hypothetical protein ACFCUJ_16720 [Thiotrichales bacterium]
MLKPSQFRPNDAWIAFRLNDAPIATERDGDFNVLCLMDAATCCIIGNEFVPVQGSVAPVDASERLIAAAQAQAGGVAAKFFLSTELASGSFSTVVEAIGATCVLASDRELAPLISDAKAGFLAYIGGGRRQ